MTLIPGGSSSSNLLHLLVETWNLLHSLEIGFPASLPPSSYPAVAESLQNQHRRCHSSNSVELLSHQLRCLINKV